MGPYTLFWGIWGNGGHHFAPNPNSTPHQQHKTPQELPSTPPPLRCWWRGGDRMGHGLPPTPPCPALLLGAADGVGDSCPIPPGARPRSSACRRPSGAPAPAPHGSAMRGLLLALCALAGKGCPPRGVGGALGVPPSTGFVLGGLSPMGAGLRAPSPWVSPCPVCAPPGTFSGACAPSPCTTPPQSCQQPPGASPAPSSPPWGAPTALRVPPPKV